MSVLDPNVWTPDVLAEYAAAQTPEQCAAISRRVQGLPPKVTDSSMIARAAEILASASRRHAEAVSNAQRSG